MTMLTKRFSRLVSLRPNCGKFGASPVSIIAVCLLLSLLIFTGCAQVTPRRNWWKGNLHTHTLWSDGDDYPEMVVEWYKQNGYHFLALSDHDILLQGEKWIDAKHNHAGEQAFQKYLERFGRKWVKVRMFGDRLQVRLKPLSEFRCLFEEPDRFLLIQAEEITDNRAHLNGVNLREVVQPQGGQTTVEVLQNNINAVCAQRQQTGQKMFAHINHPNFDWALTAEDIMQTRGALFFEVYNGHPAVHNYGDQSHAGTERMWDIILTKRLTELDVPFMYGLATDDAHNYHELGPKFANPGRGWVMVRAPHLTPESIVRAMETGEFYASTGVVLKDIRLDSKMLKIVIQAERGVSYTTQFIGTLRDYDPTSMPVVDENGNQIRATRIYSDEVGKVLAEVKGTVAKYTFCGNEVYVRAKVTSTRPKDNPFAAGDVEMAWVQPVVP
jgi:hypothetical protein